VEPLLSYKALKSADRNPQEEAAQEQQQRGVDDLVHYHQSLIRPVLEYCERTNAISRERPVVCAALQIITGNSPCDCVIVLYHLVVGWWRGTVVERRSLAGELSLSCA